MITAERQGELEALGYMVEDMGVVYGPEFNGQFRWINTLTSEFQDGDVSYSSAEAWCDADVHQLTA